MEPRIAELLQDEFATAPAREANAAIARARRERAGGGPDDDAGPAFRAYETVLTTFDAFAGGQLPRLVYHLESIGAHLPECRGVLVAAFVGEILHFVDARALIARACAMLHVTPAELVRRHGTGERRTATASGPLLLPGPKEPQ
ncbi:MAG TPA: STAUR_1299 family protein [Myxococcales bacterium]